GRRPPASSRGPAARAHAARRDGRGVDDDRQRGRPRRRARQGRGTAARAAGGAARVAPRRGGSAGCQDGEAMTASLDDGRRARLARARLYLVCGMAGDGRGDLRAFLDAALRGGVDVVQLREKEPAVGDAALLDAARAFREACDAHGALFVLNDRPDLVAAAQADGVHVGQDDMPVAETRALVGDAALIGRSTHTPAQVEDAAVADVDYFAVGPIHATPTKPGRPAVGL